jgi:hypothetical protein
MRLHPLMGAVLGPALCLANVPAWAGANDYAFEAVKAEVKSGDGQEITVRLIHKPGGHPVSGAIIFQTRLDMAPDKMADMTTKITPLQSTEPGVYHFKADFTMAGRWQLTLAAKVQGEPETIKSSVIFTAKD